MRLPPTKASTASSVLMTINVSNTCAPAWKPLPTDFVLIALGCDHLAVGALDGLPSSLRRTTRPVP